MADDVRAVPDEEYERRLSVVQAGLQEDGVDVLVAEDLGDWLPPTGDARYLSGFTLTNMVGAFQGLQIVVPAAGRPVLVVPRGPQSAFAEWARRTAFGVDVVEAADTVLGVIGAVAGMGRIARLGTGAAYRDGAALAAALPGVQIVASTANASGLSALERARATKSATEVALLSGAQRAADIGMEAFLRAVQPGRPHRVAQALARAAAIEAGADDGLVIMNAGTDPWMWWHFQGERSFPDRGIVTLEVNARVGGYCAQLARTGTVGEPDALQARLLDAGRRGVEAMVEAMRPGVTGHDLWRAGTSVLRDAGFVAWGRLGHGMGLAMDEGVAIVEGDETPIRVGSVVAVHACPWDEGSRQSGIVGEQYLMRENGPAALSMTAPDRVFELIRSGERQR